MIRRSVAYGLLCNAVILSYASAQAPRDADGLARILAGLNGVPAIDTHDHLWPFDQFRSYEKTPYGRGMNLWAVWHNSYTRWLVLPTPWESYTRFDEWWADARDDFVDIQDTSFYRYMLPAFRDLYGLDYNRITEAQARDLDRRIYDNYRDPKWVYHVVTERANIELMFIDPSRDRLGLKEYYPFQVLVLNITRLLDGFHSTEFKHADENPYVLAGRWGMEIKSLDDYVALLDRLIADAKARGAACLKNVSAYDRTIEFRDTARERAEAAFGRPRTELTPEQVRDFEDFVMWRITGLAARHDLPLQIHTGAADIRGSNPLLLLELIHANRKTKFILFHGGFPWVEDAGQIAMTYRRNVWLDAVWLPTLSYSIAKRAFHEWLEMVPSSRIMWGGDGLTPESIYGATVTMRRCLAEVLAEKVAAGAMTEERALQVGRQILRENALQLFPQLKDRLWKHKGPLEPPPATQPASDGY